MRRLAVLAMAALLAGCTQQEQAQQQLIARMQTGLHELQTAQQGRQELVDGFYQQRRRTLDEAFDQDVRAAQQLDPQWVIEHRQAYMLAVETIWKQQQASARAGEQVQQNLRTMDSSLQTLADLSRMRQQWSGMLEPKGEDNGQH